MTARGLAFRIAVVFAVPTVTGCGGSTTSASVGPGQRVRIVGNRDRCAAVRG